MLCFPALVITDGPQDKSGLADEVGSEDDLYNEFRSSSNRFGHPGGGGEQLAINEVQHTDCVCVLLFVCVRCSVSLSMAGHSLSQILLIEACSFQPLKGW